MQGGTKGFSGMRGYYWPGDANTFWGFEILCQPFRLIVFWQNITVEIDLFSFVCLLSHFRPRDGNLGNYLFQFLTYPLENEWINFWYTKKKILWEHHIIWNGQFTYVAKKVYSFSSSFWFYSEEGSLRSVGTTTRKQISQQRVEETNKTRTKIMLLKRESQVIL